MLALLYTQGTGVPRDFERALRLLEDVAMHGHVPACVQLGQLYFSVGSEANETKAASWYRVAAESGHLDAQLIVARNYLEGRGCAKDASAAAPWLRKAAEQGHSGAMFQLGAMHYMGDGVSRDLRAAAQWYRLAAEQGNSLAQHNLAEMLLNGKGIDRNTAEAIEWYTKAAKAGVLEAQRVLDHLHSGRSDNPGAALICH